MIKSSYAKKALAIMLTLVMLVSSMAVFTVSAADPNYSTFEGVTDLSSLKMMGVLDSQFGGGDASFKLSTEQNHTSGGSQALKAVIKQGMNSQRARPRMVILDASGNMIKVEAGAKYTVKFWLYTTRDDVSIQYWVSTMGDVSRITAQTNSFPGQDVHKLQPLDGANTTGTLHGNGNEVSGAPLAKNTWTEFKVTIPAAVLHMSGVDNYFALGFTVGGADVGNVNPWPGDASVWIDDITITKGDGGQGSGPINPPVGNYNTMEGLTDLSAVTQNTNKPFVLDNTRNHTLGGSQSLKAVIKDGYNTQRGRPRIVLTDKDGNKIKVTAGKTYTLKYWAYAEQAVTLQTYFSVMGDLSKITQESGSGGGDNDVHKLQNLDRDLTTGTENDNGNEVPSAPLAANTWTEFTMVVPSAVLHKAGVDNYLAFGVTVLGSDNHAAFDDTPIWIDDITVEYEGGTGGGVTLPAGNGGNGVIAPFNSKGEMEANYDTTIKKADGNDRYPVGGSGDNCAGLASSKANQIVETGIGRNDSDGAVRLKFADAPAADNAYVGYRLFDQARDGSGAANNKGQGGTTYFVTFYYKVEAPEAGTPVGDATEPVMMNLDVLYGSRNWSQSLYADQPGMLMKSVAIDAAQGTDWIKYTAIVPANGEQGFHIALVSNNKNMAKGASILIDDMSVYKIDPSSVLTVSFDANGGSSVGDLTVLYGDEVDAADLPTSTKSGMKHLGWTADGTTLLSGKFEVIDNITLKAVWQVDGDAALVTFKANGGTAVYKDGEKLTDYVEYKKEDGAPALNASLENITTTRKGYTFVGWFKDVNGTLSVPAITEPGQYTLYAGWTRTTDEVMNFEDYAEGEGTSLANVKFEEPPVAGFYTQKQANYFYTNVTNKLNHPDADFGIVNGEMKMSYVAGQAKTIDLAGFRVTDAAGAKIVVEPGNLYELSFDYRIESATADGAITMLNGSCNWGNPESTGFDAAYKKDAVTFVKGETTQGSATVPFKAEVANGVHLALNIPDDANRGGTVVYVDNVKLNLYTRDPATLPQYSKDTDGVVVSDEQNHTAGGSKAAKVIANNKSTHDNNRVTFANIDGVKTFAVNKSYVVTAWVYSETEIAGAKVRFVNEVPGREADWFANKAAAEAELTLPAGQWVKIERLYTPVGDGTATEVNLAVGVYAPFGNPTVYVDDISVVDYVQDMSAVQTYEAFKTGDNTGINGNGSGKEVSAEQNHTDGGANSLKLKMNQEDMTKVARTVLKVDYTDFKAEVGKGYVVQFWAYSAEGGVTKFCLGSAGDTAMGNADKRNDKEGASEIAVNLPAGKWTQLALMVESVAGKGGETNPYLTLNAWFDGASDSNIKHLYIDDVTVSDYVPYVPIDNKTMTFENVDMGKNLAEGLSIFPMNVTTAANNTEGGMRALGFDSGNSSGGGRPQFNITDGEGNLVNIEAGKNYSVSFWVYTTDENAGIRYWLTANEDANVVYTSGGDKDARKLYEQNTPVSLTAGKWMEIKATISGTDAIHGYLRLGIDDDLGHTGLSHKTFYVDDVLVKEIKPVSLNPNATSFDMEAIAIGDNSFGGQKFVLNGSASVSDRVNHTPDGSHALELYNVSWAGTNRNQTLVLDPKTCEPLKVEANQAYTLSFWVYIRKNDVYLPDEEEPGLQLNHWIAITDDISQRFNKGSGVKVEYDAGGTGSFIKVEPDTWVQVSTSFNASRSGYVVLGTTDTSNYADAQGDHNSNARYYIDDIKVAVPEYVTVVFDTRAEDCETKYLPLNAIVGQPLSSDAAKVDDGSAEGNSYTDPFRVGYEFTGWYSTPECKETDLVEFDYTVVKGKDGDVITLYAGWVAYADDGDESDKKDEIIYKSEVIYDKVWIGDSVQDPVIEAGDRPEVEEADPVKTSPKDDNDDPSGNKGESAAWLIIVIIVAAVVVVGGGAALALLLLKKKA